ncbi:DUF4230 domain-containing protein [Sporosarcina sp. HYO08]|uniref:DUF4230 domain-containing protein n=1 Tax=Sporosarcina sp. HYO08 TaxID=1759557 RepID=UPI00079310B6|nr:DUF4230 domain-containing protein [Sporosarcina sp. HYO08]KXH83922.1 hypothetical protein AU377_03995 [Sporosarcina sp. HYO08]
MKGHKKLNEIERLLQELKDAKKETAVTIDVGERRSFGFWRTVRLIFPIWRKSYIFIAILALALIIALPFAAFFLLKQGSTFSEQKGAYLERIQSLNELATAEAYTKVIIERQDNTLFGQSIGLNLPGTKRQLLVVVPGSVKAGVDFSRVTEKDIQINHDEKTATLTLPPATFLGGAEIYFDQVEVYSYEGLFREKANIEEAYELAAEAKKLILEETAGQGVLTLAEQNAEKTLREMFSFAGYDVMIKFKE